METSDTGEVPTETSNIVPASNPVPATDIPTLVQELASVKKLVKGLLVATVALSVLLLGSAAVQIGSRIHFDHDSDSYPVKNFRMERNESERDNRFGSESGEYQNSPRRGSLSDSDLQDLVPQPPQGRGAPSLDNE